LLNIVTSPAEVKEQLDMLSKAAAKLDAATQANKADSAASVWFGRLRSGNKTSNNQSRGLPRSVLKVRKRDFRRF
jgi:hypothetical protein